jgi:hypothetical protein
MWGQHLAQFPAACIEQLRRLSWPCESCSAMKHPDAAWTGCGIPQYGVAMAGRQCVRAWAASLITAATAAALRAYVFITSASRGASNNRCVSQQSGQCTMHSAATIRARLRLQMQQNRRVHSSTQTTAVRAGTLSSPRSRSNCPVCGRRSAAVSAACSGCSTNSRPRACGTSMLCSRVSALTA